MPGDRERCLAAGATDYMTKPVSLKALAELVARLTPPPVEAVS
jgi:CheY-like chemotaxis protein